MKAQKNLTEMIKKRSSLKLVNFFDHIPPLLANIFSILFATSIILELKNIVSHSVMILLTIFILLFLIQNEVIKVKQIRNFFQGKKNSLISFSITFIISVFLSGIGMWLYTNKSTEIKDNSEINKNVELNDVSNKYQTQFDEIYNITFEDTKEYKSMLNEIDYWKGKTASSLNERTELRERVEKLQNALISSKNTFIEGKKTRLEQINKMQENEKNIVLSKYDKNINITKSNDLISYIFLTLILITEFATIILNKNFMDKKMNQDNFFKSKIANKYIVSSNILTALYLTAKNNIVNINMAKYSQVNGTLEWDEVKEIYNNFITLGILSNGNITNFIEKGILENELLLSEKEANRKLDIYFERFLNIVD